MARFVSLLAALLSLVTLQTPAFALSYDASVFLSISTPGGPFATTLTLAPGAIHFANPIVVGRASVTYSGSASTPGQIQVGTTGGGVGIAESLPLAFSRGTAVGLGSIEVARAFAFFPLHIHEMWSLSAIGGGTQASIDLKVFLDGVPIHSRSARVAGGWPDVEHALADDVTTKLFLPLSLGINNLVFTAEAAGLIVTPEPASLLLFGSTVAGLGWLARRRHGQRTSG